MAEVQDDDQWLYGDDKDEGKDDDREVNEKADDQEKAVEENGEEQAPAEVVEGGEEAEKDKDEDKEKDKINDEEDKEDKDKEGTKDGTGKGDEDDSSDDDDVTITIGVLKTQPDIIQAPMAPPSARLKAIPTAGLKDEDFSSPGKVNGVPITEFNMAELEEKPWRKPGADISDYFNYGFNEETWFRYCERQKRMRINESGAGLAGLGISITKPFGNTPNTIPVTIVNDNSKYGGSGSQRPKAGPPPRNKGMGQIDVIGGASSANKTSTIQVMTADRREYSNKVMSGPPPPPSQPSYNDMEFGGNPYGDAYYPGDNSFYGGGGGFDNPQPWGTGQAPPIGQNNWDGPGSVPPPTVTPVSSAPGYFEEESMNAPPPPPEPEEERHRSRRSHRSRSRSPSRHRHSGRHRSRSRSPSHRHKRKKSKRERDTD